MIHHVRGLLLLCALLSGGPALAAESAPGSPEAEALALVDDRCAADDLSAEACACHRKVFRENILSRSPDPQVARLAAMIHAGDAVDQMKMLELLQSAGPDAMQDAGALAVGAQLAFEACDDRAREAQRTADRQAALPEGDDGRSRFVRQCAGQNGQLGICECVADKLLESLDPLELAVLVDLRDARERGDAAMQSFAEERGMTVEEAKQALMQMGGRISVAMMSIDPAACAGVTR